MPVYQPYSREFFVPRPAAFTLFFRTFVPWQLVRFVAVNIKMIRMIGKSHSHRALPPASTSGAGGLRPAAATSIAR
jgi:hypothetical protein